MQRGPGSGHRRGGGIAAVLALSLLSGPAEANGRYPAAQQILQDPSNPDRLWLRATYGVLTSEDHGETWRWICETSMGYQPREDPPLLVASDGTVLAATAHALLVNRDGGCTWEAHPDIGERFTADITASPDATRLFALTTKVQPNGDYDLVVWISEDAGASFRELGPPLSSDLSALTVDVAPSDPARLYVTGLPVSLTPPPLGDAGSSDAGPVEPPGVLLRSKDGGATWTRVSIPASTIRDYPYIAAVHPTNPDALYVRVRGRPKARGAFIESWLLYSDDAGDTWKEIFRGSADMLGFALGPTGTPVWLGLGDSFDESRQRTVDPTAIGIYRADTPDSRFQPLLRGQVGCLAVSADGLYVCSTTAAKGFEVGLSADEGNGAEPVLALGDRIKGPLSCELGNQPAFACVVEWRDFCGTLSACGSPPTDAGTPLPPPKKPKDTGCGCAVGAAGEEPVDGWVIGLALVAALATRRRHSWT